MYQQFWKRGAEDGNENMFLLLKLICKQLMFSVFWNILMWLRKTATWQQLNYFCLGRNNLFFAWTRQYFDWQLLNVDNLDWIKVKFLWMLKTVHKVCCCKNWTGKLLDVKELNKVFLSIFNRWKENVDLIFTFLRNSEHYWVYCKAEGERLSGTLVFVVFLVESGLAVDLRKTVEWINLFFGCLELDGDLCGEFFFANFCSLRYFRWIIFFLFFDFLFFVNFKFCVKFSFSKRGLMVNNSWIKNWIFGWI